MYASVPFTLDDDSPACLLRVMQSGRNYLTVLTNGSAKAVSCVLQHDHELHGTRIWESKNRSDKSTFPAAVSLGPRQTIVDLWR
jgi:hypothetical protein